MSGTSLSTDTPTSHCSFMSHVSSASLQPIGRLVGHSGTVSTMAFLNEQTLATGARDRLVKVSRFFCLTHVDVLYSGSSMMLVHCKSSAVALLR